MIVSYVSTSMEKRDFAALFLDAKTMPGQQGPKFNRLLMEGLVANGVEVHACTGRPVTRANCRRLFLSSKKHVKEEKLIYLYGSVLNLPVIKNIWQIVISYLTICKEIRRGTAVVICDVLNASISYGAIMAAKRKKTPCIGLVTDLPELMVTGVNQTHVEMVGNIIRNCSGYVFLTEAMNEKLNLSRKPYIVIEGLCDTEMQSKERIECKGKSKYKYVYAGYLDARYGVKMLVDGFLEAELPNVELHIFGNGPYSDELRNVVKENSNVVYHGIVENDAVVQAEQAADLLINPRPTKEEFTKYSFPSKNLEYMATGTPVLTTCLPGMPEEYKQYVFLLEDESKQGMCKCLKKLFETDDNELRNKGLMARQFVLNEKNNRIQSNKMIELINQLLLR